MAKAHDNEPHMIADDFYDWEERDEGFPLHSHIVAGSCAGIMEHLGMFPIDTVKTHMQASHRKLGFIQTIRILYKDEGLFRFWKGA